MNSTSTSTRARRFRRLAATVGASAAIALGAAACSSGGGSSAHAAKATTTSAASGQVPAGQSNTQAGSSSGSTNTGNNGGNNGGGGGGGTSSTPAPVITSFQTPENIDCHNGNLQNFTASWATQNAVKVTISIDGPGVYNTYGPSGSTSLPFNCSSSHTFLLTAYGSDGQTATSTVTLQPRNAQPTTTDTNP